MMFSSMSPDWRERFDVEALAKGYITYSDPNPENGTAGKLKAAVWICFSGRTKEKVCLGRVTAKSRSSTPYDKWKEVKRQRGLPGDGSVSAVGPEHLETTD